MNHETSLVIHDIFVDYDNDNVTDNPFLSINFTYLVVKSLLIKHVLFLKQFVNTMYNYEALTTLVGKYLWQKSSYE